MGPPEGRPLLASAALVLVLGGSGLGLVGADEPFSPEPEPVEAPQPSDPDPASGAVALLGLAAAAAALASRTGPSAALGLQAPEDALVVFVPGHGQRHGDEVFADLVDLMGLEDDDARFFDYRWVTGDHDPARAAQKATVGPTAMSLNGYLNGVAAEGRPVWLIGFSKGGATVAELVAAWDEGVPGAESVEGVTLLDPPMAAGLHGWLQSTGKLVGWVPDDGGYDPVECAFLWFGCHDARANLGANAGVDVLVVRNPNAGITSFSDRPSGLRVVDAPDRGPDVWGQLMRNPLHLVARITEAHESVLTDPRVARCIVEEMWNPGSCSLQVQMLPSLRPVIRAPIAASMV